MKYLVNFFIILYYAVYVIFAIYCLVMMIPWAWKILAGMALSMLYWYVFILPLLYFFPKAVTLAFKGILRPVAVLKSLMAPLIGLAVTFLITAGYFENAPFKSCLRVVANWGISITGPVTFYTSGIFLLVIVFCAIFIKDARMVLVEDGFWDKMNQYKKITAL